MQVLIVDDDKTIVELIQNSVSWEKLGITSVDVAYHVAGAKEILERKKIDIVISDIEMPKESGIDLLRWFRESNQPGKFLLLTCYESFQYAVEAIKYNASEYLVKPFNVEIMEMVLKKLTAEIQKERKTEEKMEFADWFLNNQKEIKKEFWQNLFLGRNDQKAESIDKEILERNLEIDSTRDYRLIFVKATNLEADIQTYGNDLVAFILENLMSEILLGSAESDRILCFREESSYFFVMISVDEKEALIQEKCNRMKRKCEELLSLTLTGYISRICKINEFYSVFQSKRNIFAKNVMFYGQIFSEDQVLDLDENTQPQLQLETMEDFLSKRMKKEFINYLIKEINTKTRLKLLDGNRLNSMVLEIQQAIYSHLAKEGVSISLLLGDEVSEKMRGKASQSAEDIIKWTNYILEKVFSYENQLEKNQTLIDKINRYIEQHYMEDIGRNEIGEVFYLMPEYLARIYKRKTGKVLKDAINEYRIKKAQQLLLEPEAKVSEVALQVGFDNYSYFSTLFKKYTNCSPNEYKRKCGN